MSYYFTDDEISDLITEPKVFNGTIEDLMRFKESAGHESASAEIPRDSESSFLVILRQNKNNINDFSAIFAYQQKGNNTDFKLKRYNGRSHEHSNRIEGEKFYSFHIHSATARYQDAGLKEEKYAEKTDRYSSLKGALKCLLQDCNISVGEEAQSTLFEE